MKKQIKISLLFLALILLIPNGMAYGQEFVRPNGFLDISGPEKVNQIKKFQAVNNLNVDGITGRQTEDLLYNPNIGPIDKVENPPSQGNWIVINKSKKILTVYQGYNVLGKYAVTLGTNKTPTPSTKAYIETKEVNPSWGGIGGKYNPISANDPRNPLGERWMGLKITGTWGYGIHGTIKPWEIGTYSSNGCIRMFNYDIENFVFPIMKIGDPVWIGTDQELNSWGVYQYVGQLPQEPDQEKPLEENPPRELPPIKLLINNQIVQSDSQPIIEDGRTLVPIRVISENLGYEVLWNKENRTIEVLNKDPQGEDIIDVLILQMDSDIIRRIDPKYYLSLEDQIRNSKDYIKIIEPRAQEIKIDVPARIVNDRTLVPIRLISEEFGALVDWDNDTRTVIVNQ